MSIGQPCRHCSHGKMRPIHFSWDQAVVICDNKRCKSLLDFSPSECIIQKDVLCPTQQSSSEYGLQCLLNDGSSRSSSGVYSGGSSLLSPAQSGKSITDEEVEFLLKASYAPLSYKDTPVTSSVSSKAPYAPLCYKGTTVTSSVLSGAPCIPLSCKDTTITSSVSSGTVTHTQISSNLQNSQSDSSRYDGFFELLGNLDLEPQSQPVNLEPQTESSLMETSFDVVTAELEGWMKDFDFTSACFDSHPSSDPSDVDQRPPDEAVRVASLTTTNMQGSSIPSQSSAFIPIDPSKEYSASFDTELNSSVNSFVSQRSLVVNNDTQNQVQQSENPCFATLFESEFVNGNISNFHTRFMSPTASAVSEDSGYNEEDSKATAGAEPLASEENSKISTKIPFLYSPLKNQNSYSLNKLITQTTENNLKDLIQNNLEWPIMSGMHTLTVLPAIVSTEESIVNTPQEPLRPPSTSQATGSDEPYSAVEDTREQADLNTEEQAEMPRIPSGLGQDNENESVPLGNHSNALTNDICTAVQDEREQVDLSTEEQTEMPQTSLREYQANEHESIPLGSKENALTNDICTAILDQRDQDDLSTEKQAAMPWTPLNLLHDKEHKSMPLGNHENALTNNVCTAVQDEREQVDLSPEETMSIEHNENALCTIDAGSPSESSRVFVTSPTPESTVSEGSSHSTSEAIAVSENVDASKLYSSASSTMPENESRKRRHETGRCLRVRKHSNSSTRKHSSGDNNTFPNSKISKVRGKRKPRGVEDIKERSKRKGRNPRLRSEREKQGSLRKASLGKLTKRSGNVSKVHRKEQLTTSSGKNYFLENIAEKFLEGDHSVDVPGCQTQDGGTNHLGPRGKNLSPRKLLIGHVNKDPWSVMDLSLEELTIEIVVEGKQREASSHPDKAAKCNGLLQQLMSYFSRESESEVSQVPTKDTVQDVSSKVMDKSLLGNDSDCLSKGKNSGDSDNEEKTVGMDGNQKLVGKNAQTLQTPENQFNAKNFSTESESDVSHALATVMRQCMSLKASEGMSLENKYRKYSFEGRNLDFNDSEEKTTHRNGNQSMMGNSEQNLQVLENQLSSKNKSKYSEPEVSHVPPENTVQGIPPESNEALLDMKSGECLFKEENLEISDCKEEIACGDGTQNLRRNSGQNLHLENQGSTKKLNPLNADETKLKDPSLKTFHRLPSELDHSQLNVIGESKYVMSMVQRNAQLVPGSCTGSTLLPDINSTETEEHAPNVEIGSKSLFSEESNSIEPKEHAPNVDIGSIHSFSKEIGFVRQLYPSWHEEGVVVSSSEDEIKQSGDAGKKSNMKQCFDKQLVEAGNHSVVLENCGSNKEKFSSEEAEHPSFSLNNVNVIEKATDVSQENHELETEKFSNEETRHPSSSVDTLSSSDKTPLETMKTQCISTSDSALKIIEWKSSWFDDNFDKNLSDSAAVERERFIFTKPMTNTLDQSCDSEVDGDSLSSSSSREASPLHFLNPPKWERVRNWIGYEDIVSVEEQNKENNDSSNPCPDFKSLPSSSMYFQSLVEDMDFDENFFQCHVQESPSETFPEHLKSSLFFGETASNDYSPSHAKLSEEPLPEFKSCSKSNIFNMSLPQTCNNFAGSEPSAAYTQVPVPLPSSIAQTLPTSIYNNIFPHSVSSILGGKMSGRKLLIIPKKSQVRHMVVASHGMNSNLAGSALLSPDLQSPAHRLLPDHSEMVSGGKGVECKKNEYVNKSGNHITSWVTETLPESTEEQPSCSTSEVTGMDCLAESVKGKLSCADDFTNLFSEGEGSEQVNHHISPKFIEPDKSCENSVVSSHFPTLGTQHRESRLDETLETKWESELHPTSYTSGLSNSDTSKQTSLCFCVSVGDDFKVCDCNTGSFEHKKDITVHCMEQTSHKIDIFCGSDADMSSTTSLDSGDEIHITVAGKAIDHHYSTQAGKESVTSDENCIPEKYLVNNHVNHSCYNDQSIETKLNENFMTDNSLVNDIHVNQCHSDESMGTELNEVKECKASHLLLLSGSELKRKADDQCEPFKKQRLHDRLTDIPIEKSMHTCENHSKPTYTGQCGTLMCGILDDSVLHDESCRSSSHAGFQDFPTKDISKKRPLKKAKTYTRFSKQCIATKSNENEVSSLLKSYVDKESAAGDDYLVCSSTKEITNLTIEDTTIFSHNSEFGSLKACPQYDDYSCLRVENDVNDLDFFQVASSYTGFLAPLISPAESLASLPESEQEERDAKHCVLQESGSSQEGRENESIDIKNVKHKQSLLLEEIKQNTSDPALAANQDGIDAKMICTASHTGPQISGTNDISKNVNQLSVSCKDGELLNKSVCNDSIMFAKLGQNNNCNTTQRSSPHASGSQKLKRIIIFRKPSQSFQSVPQGSNSFIKTSSTPTLVPNSPLNASTSPAVSTCGLSAALTITSESHSRSLYVSGVAPHSRVMLPTLPSSQKKAPYPRAIASPSFPYSNFRTINFNGSGTEKEHQVSCQKTALPNKYSVVLPALTCSDANASTSLACQPLGSASMRGSSVGHSLERVDSPLDPLNHMKYNRELITQNEKKSDTQEEAANMLKKVKLGSKGSFYLRPTPALKNAILEMRKKASGSKIIETNCDYMTLPDGIPIPHPIFIPKRNEANQMQVVRFKKAIRKKRVKRVKDLVKEKVKESLESCNDEIPKMIVIYARRSFHICHIDVTETR